jgi:hypothetical protein
MRWLVRITGHTFRKSGSVSVLRWVEETPTQLGPSETEFKIQNVNLKISFIWFISCLLHLFIIYLQIISIYHIVFFILFITYLFYYNFNTLIYYNKNIQRFARIPYCPDYRLTDGGKVVSPHSTPLKHYFSASGTLFCERLRKLQGLLRSEGLGKLKKSIQLIGSRNLDLTACSIEP